MERQSTIARLEEEKARNQNIWKLKWLMLDQQITNHHSSFIINNRLNSNGENGDWYENYVSTDQQEPNADHSDNESDVGMDVNMGG